jgi:hypothetical protein
MTQEGGVVHIGQLLPGDPQTAGQTRRDKARAHCPALLLTHSQVGEQGDGGDILGKARSHTTWPFAGSGPHPFSTGARTSEPYSVQEPS